MSWELLVGSLLAVLALTGIARLLGLGLGASGLTSEKAAMLFAEEQLPGFEARSAVLDPERDEAVVTGIDGKCIRLRRHGARFVVEPF